MPEIISIAEITLYDPSGTAVRTYQGVELDSERVIDISREYPIKSFSYLKPQTEWNEYFSFLNDGRELLSTAVLYACMEKMVEQRHLALPELINDLEKYSLCTNTTFDYEESTICHQEKGKVYSTEFSLPEGLYQIENALENKDLSALLQALFMPQSMSKLIEVFHIISKQCLSIRVASLQSNRKREEKLGLLDLVRDAQKIKRNVVSVGNVLNIYFIDGGCFLDSSFNARGIRLGF